MTTTGDNRVMRQLAGDDASRGIELALTPVVFGGLGWLVDGWLGTGPVFAILLAALATVSTVAKMWFAYTAEMDRHEASSRWSRRRAEPAAGDAATDADPWSTLNGGAQA